MKKRDMLIAWAKEKNDWFYLNEVPRELFGLSLASTSTALIELCKKGKMDFRVVGLKQYRLRN